MTKKTSLFEIFAAEKDNREINKKSDDLEFFFKGPPSITIKKSELHQPKKGLHRDIVAHVPYVPRTSRFLFFFPIIAALGRTKPPTLEVSFLGLRFFSTIHCFSGRLSPSIDL